MFAGQVHLDIRYILDEGFDRPQKEVILAAERHRSTLLDQQEFSQHVNDRKKLCAARQILIEMDGHIFDDLDLENRAFCFEGLKEPIQPNLVELFYLYRRHPLLSGLRQFRIEIIVHEDGLSIANR